MLGPRNIYDDDYRWWTHPVIKNIFILHLEHERERLWGRRNCKLISDISLRFAFFFFCDSATWIIAHFHISGSSRIAKQQAQPYLKYRIFIVESVVIWVVIRTVWIIKNLPNWLSFFFGGRDKLHTFCQIKLQRLFRSFTCLCLHQNFSFFFLVQLEGGEHNK